jgi:hypothetical protein
MTNSGEWDGETDISERREMFRELNPRAEQLLSEPDLVHKALDDAMFVEAFVWSITIAQFLLCGQQWNHIYIEGIYPIYKREAILKLLNLLTVLFDSAFARDFKTIHSFD